MFKKLLVGMGILSLSLFGQSDSFTERVKVDYSKAIYETVEEFIPHRHDESCFEEYQIRRPHHNSYSYKDENSIGVDTLIGAAGGVIIGNQIGKGNGKVAAKVIGGLIGAGIANSMRNNRDINNNEYHSDNYYYETKKRNICKQNNRKVVRKNILKGYENYFSYNGKTYSKFTENKVHHIQITTRINF